MPEAWTSWVSCEVEAGWWLEVFPVCGGDVSSVCGCWAQDLFTG